MHGLFIMQNSIEICLPKTNRPYCKMKLVFLCLVQIFSLLQNADTQEIVQAQFSDFETPQISTVKKISVIPSPFRTRPFRTTTEVPALHGQELNDIDDDPIPTKVWIPAGLQFSCKGRSPGYYTDPSPLSKCQVYHMCMSDGRKYSMLCGIGTIFNQITFVCDHWYNYHCSDAESDYKRNDRLWNQFLSPVSGDDEDDYEDSPTTPTP